MSKKDYQAIARVLKAVRTGATYDGESYAVARCKNVETMLADMLAADNPRFDRARFLEACETGRCG